MDLFSLEVGAIFTKFLDSFVQKIQFSLTLIAFSDSSPIFIIDFDAVALHERVYKFVLSAK